MRVGGRDPAFAFFRMPDPIYIFHDSLSGSRKLNLPQCAMPGGRRSLGLYKEMKMEQDKPKYTIPDDETRYTIPEEALEDEVFARMIKEAEKYLG